MARDIQWVAADGTAIRLTDRAAGWRVLDRTTGLSSPPYEVPEDQYAGEDGAEEGPVRAQPRDVNLAVQLEVPSGSGDLALRRKVAALTRAMRPKLGAGRLVVTDEEGGVRTLTCRYRSGLDGDEARTSTIPGRWWRAIVKLRAADPWWYGPEVPVDFGLAAPTPFFPILPVRLSSSSVQGEFEVDLTGADAESYPLWTITGPGSSLTLANRTTGQQIQVNAELGDGQKMIIDTRRGRQSVMREDGVNLMGALATDPAMWSLAERLNKVSAQLNSAGANSRIHGVYAPRYAGA